MKKLIALICASALALSLGACGTPAANDTKGQDTSSAANTQTEAADTSWTDIEKAGKIVIGVDDQFPPMGFLDESGELVGFDIDLAKAVCENLGLEAEFKAINWDSKEAELQSKNIDLIWNGYSITDERQQKVLFSKPYLANHQVIITKEGNNIAVKDDLKSAKIGVQAGSSALDAIQGDPIYSEIEGNLNEYDTNVMAMLDLDAGNVQAIVMDEVVANYYISKKAEGGYIILDDNFGSEEFGVGMRMDAEEFQKKLQASMDEVMSNDKGLAVSTQWFGQDKFLK